MTIDFRDWQQRNEENGGPWYWNNEQDLESQEKEFEEQEERRNRQPLFEGGE